MEKIIIHSTLFCYFNSKNCVLYNVFLSRMYLSYLGCPWVLLPFSFLTLRNIDMCPYSRLLVYSYVSILQNVCVDRSEQIGILRRGDLAPSTLQRYVGECWLLLPLLAALWSVCCWKQVRRTASKTGNDLLEHSKWIWVHFYIIRGWKFSFSYFWLF